MMLNPPTHLWVKLRLQYSLVKELHYEAQVNPVLRGTVENVVN